MSVPLLIYLSLPFFTARTYSMLMQPVEEDTEHEAFFTSHLVEGLAHLLFLATVLGAFALLASLGFCKHLHDQIRDEL